VEELVVQPGLSLPLHQIVEGLVHRDEHDVVVPDEPCIQHVPPGRRSGSGLWQQFLQLRNAERLLSRATCGARASGVRYCFS